MEKKSFIWILAFLMLFLFGSIAYVYSVKQKTISWEEAIDALHQGQVDSFIQYHSLKVVFYLKDGRKVEAKEPSIHSIMNEFNKCGSPCEGMSFGTE